MKTPGWILALLIALAAFTPPAAAAEPMLVRAWDEETLDLASRIPIQEGGRIKPLATFARFRLLALNGKTRCDTSRDEDAAVRRSSLEWLLDTLFYPEVARHYPVFLLRTTEVLDALGLPHTGRKKSDRYSYDELSPGREALHRLWAQYGRIEAKERDPVEAQVVHLAQNVFLYEQVLHALDFARHPHSVGGARSAALAILPPADPDESEWRTPASVTDAALRTEEDLAVETGLVARLEDLVRSRDDPAGFRAQLMALLDGIRERAEGRGEYEKIGLEVAFYRGSYFHWSLGFFAIGFVLLALSWLRALRILRFAVPPMLVVALVPLVIGITLRCVIRGRPPVTTLYETILFVTATGVITALVVEWMTRRRIAVAFAAALGLAGLFLAMRYEIKEGQDTMPSLVAVLDTNFWLATHVTTVTLGYSAGLLAALLAHVYVVGRLFGFRRDDADLYRNVTRMVYGVICFGLFFSVLGTILGGIWANDSWGRFWGWDPKENGALMIVLWELALIHGHLGGYLRQLGINLAAIFGGVIVVFSWWGVNLLGVGLHSYGFTSGILRTILVYGGIEGLFLLAGLGIWIADRVERRAKALAVEMAAEGD